MKTLKKNNISQGSSINSPVPVNKDCELPPFLNEDYFGHVVVQTIAELNDIPCKLRQDGMVATVVQDSYAEWQLQSSRIGFSKCDNRSWVKINSGDTFYDGSNLFIFPTQAEADVYKSTPAVKEGQVIYIIETNTYFKYDGQDEYVDPFPNKLTVPTEDGVEGPDYKVPAYLADGTPYWRSTKDFGKVKSVNGKEGDVILKTSDLENNSDYTTNAILTAHTSNKANPHEVTKEQIGLGNVDNTSDLSKPISTATQNELNKKVNSVNGINPDNNKNIKVGINEILKEYQPNIVADKSKKVLLFDEDGKTYYFNLSNIITNTSVDESLFVNVDNLLGVNTTSAITEKVINNFKNIIYPIDVSLDYNYTEISDIFINSCLKLPRDYYYIISNNRIKIKDFSNLINTENWEKLFIEITGTKNINYEQ